MKKELYCCNICRKTVDEFDLFEVNIPVKITYNSIGITQTAIEEREICWNCCKKIAEFIDKL